MGWYTHQAHSHNSGAHLAPTLRRRKRARACIVGVVARRRGGTSATLSRRDARRKLWLR